MARWIQKGNARRFYRIDMPIKLFIVPQTSIQDAEIYATGADYIPPGVQAKIAQNKADTLHWVSQIQDQKIIVNRIFSEAIENIEFFGSSVEKISLGLNPRNNMEYWTKIKALQNGFNSAHDLKEAAPRTYQYFKLIEDKFLYFLNSMADCVSNSNPEALSVDRHIPYGFKIDEILEQFDQPKFEKIPLVQSLRFLGKLITSYTDIYRQITDDNSLRQFPEEWKTLTVNVSASGLAARLDKRFKQYDKLDVFFYFPETDAKLHFDASVVDIRTIDTTYKERIAVNFDFPDGKDQNQLQSEIQKYEIKECMDIDLSC